MIGALCAHFHWQHDFWRAPGTDGRVMGWRELKAWFQVYNRQRSEPETNPDSWENADNDSGWQELRDKRDAWRGR